jgi:hypothetical protein
MGGFFFPSNDARSKAKDIPSISKHLNCNNALKALLIHHLLIFLSDFVSIFLFKTAI